MGKKVFIFLVGCLMLLVICGVAKEVRDKVIVVIDAVNEGMLRDNELPYIFRGADYFIAEWELEELEKAAALKVGVEVVMRGVRGEESLYIFEVSDLQRVPEEWKGKILYQRGHDYLLNIREEEVGEWVDKGYHVIKLPRERRYISKERVSYVPYNCNYNATIADLLSRTSQVQWVDWIQKLSGVESVVIGGTTYTITRRPSAAMFSGDVNAKGYDFVLWQVQSYHYGTNIEEDPYGSSGWKNIILTIPGQTTPNEVVGYSAHLDDRPSTGNAPGADDNATGSAALLEAARLFRQFRFQRTIKIMFFTGEEDGLLGSGAYVQDHNVSNYLGVLNQDMFGYDPDADSCYEMHIGTMSSSADVANCMVNSISAYSIPLSYDYITSGATSASDHSSFWNVGVGAIETSENFFSAGSTCGPAESNPYYHTSNDTLANAVTLPFAYNVYRAAIASVAAMAIPIQACFTSAPTLTATGGTYKVDLSWTSVSGAASYRVFRSTQGCEGQWFERVETTNLSWTDNNVTPGTTYYYYVEAVASDGFCVSKMSNCASAVPSTGPHASYQSDTKTDDCPSGGPGDGNGVIDPGETVVTAITIVNDGSGSLANITGTLSTATSGVTILDDSATFPDISSPGGTSTSNPPHFNYQVGDSFTCGADISFDLNLTYTGGSNSTSFTHKVGQQATTTIFSETWESGSTNWTMSGLWHLTTEAAQNCMAEPYPSPVTVAYYGQDSTCNFNTGSTTSGNLDRTAAISGITTNSQLTFMFVNGNEGSSSYDISYVYVSPDGTTWTQVWTWAGTQQPTWAQAGPISLSSWAGQSIYLRFRFNSVDGTYNNYLGWAVDNINISGTSWQCNVCQQTSNPPGRVLNNLTVAKSGSDLVLNWQAPGGECDTTVKYSLYRGTLNPAGSFSYNHASQNCNITSTSTTIAQGTDSYYYLIVHQNANNQEGIPGLTSGGSQIPQGSNPCATLNDTGCN